MVRTQLEQDAFVAEDQGDADDADRDDYVDIEADPGVAAALDRLSDMADDVLVVRAELERLTDHVKNRLGGGVVDATLLAESQRQVAQLIAEVDRLREQNGEMAGIAEAMDARLIELERLRGHVAVRDQQFGVVAERAAALGYVAGCAQCENPADQGHECVICRDGEGVFTLVPHGYARCPEHVAVAQVVDVDRAGNLVGEGKVPDSAELLRAAIERYLGTCWVPVPRTWRNVPVGAVFVGRKGDLWLVSKAAGEVGEHDKGKVTVKVQTGQSKGGVQQVVEFARSFDPDQPATVLVPATEQEAIDLISAGLLAWQSAPTVDTSAVKS